MIIKEKGQARVKVLVIIFVIVLIATIYVLYTNLARPGVEVAPVEEAVSPEEAKIEAPVVTTFNLDIVKKLAKLDLKLFGKLPIEVSPDEIGRTNPFIPY